MFQTGWFRVFQNYWRKGRISSNAMSFEYVLTIDGKSLKKFVEVQAKNTRVWLPSIAGGSEHRIVLGTRSTLLAQ